MRGVRPSLTFVSVGVIMIELIVTFVVVVVFVGGIIYLNDITS
jgi:hypothetical protein